MTSFTCFECGQPGHLAADCPNRGSDGGPVDADAPWCGGCDQRTRHTTDADGREHRCRRCWLPRLAAAGHPDTRHGLALGQHWGMDPATKLRARFLRETDYGRRPPSPDLEAELQAAGIRAEVGAAEARSSLGDRPPPPERPAPLHGEALAAEQVREARAAHLEPATSSGNGHRPAEELPEGEFPF